MPTYMLLFYDNPEDFRGLSPAEMQRIIERYRAWNGGLRERGILGGGEKLRDDAGRVVRREGERLSVTDGPFSEAKEVLGGVVSVEAKNYDGALALLRDCPHLDYGTVVVREVEVMVRGE